MNTSITHLSVMCVGGGGEGVGPICDEDASFCRIQDGVQVLNRSTKSVRYHDQNSIFFRRRLNLDFHRVLYGAKECSWNDPAPPLTI